MLPYVAITAALAFFLLWRLGLLEDLQRTAPGRRDPLKRRRLNRPRPQVAPPPEEKTEDRLEVFEKFIKKLSDDDDPEA